MKRHSLHLLILSALLCANPVQAGIKPHFGLKGGLNLGNMSFEGQFETELTMKSGFIIGGVIQVPLKSSGDNFYFNGEAYFVQKGVKEKYSETGIDVDLGYYDYKYKGSLNLNEIAFATIFGVKTKTIPKFLVETGLEVGLVTSSEYKYKETLTSTNYYPYSASGTTDVQENINSPELSLILGAGLEIPGTNLAFVLNPRFVYGLTNVIDEPDGTGKTWGFLLLAGMLF
jgi:hypothetical protein